MPQLEVKTSGDITGLRWQPGDAAAVLSRPARARDAPRVPPRPRRAVLTSSNSPERAAQSFLKFLALGPSPVQVSVSPERGTVLRFLPRGCPSRRTGVLTASDPSSPTNVPT